MTKKAQETDSYRSKVKVEVTKCYYDIFANWLDQYGLDPSVELDRALTSYAMSIHADYKERARIKARERKVEEYRRSLVEKIA